MRTLLIDNHDSYTYNLFHLIAKVNGVEPVVLRNDEPALARASFDEFDNVVISPGPGHPGRARDLGHAARFLRQDHLPVLGVCLGHQGIGLLAGAAVGPAPAARHGHPTSVRHDGRELFAGLPQDFTAVRYHSLCIEEPLPPDLQATAWAEDGVVMGLRHRRKPQWGVQFHPESILTECGSELLGNFRALSQTVQRPSIVTTASPQDDTSAVVTRLSRHRLHVAIHNGPVATEQLFTSLFAASPRSFWLDGAGVDDGLSRFSYLGDDTGPLSEFCSYDVNSGVVTVHRTGEPVRQVREDVFTYLRRRLAAHAFTPPDLPFDFTCGYVGYFGYELKAALGGQAAHRSATPDAGWLFADRMVVIDRVDQTAYVLCLAEDSPAAEAEAIGWIDATLEHLAYLPTDAPRSTVSTMQHDVPDVIKRWLLRDAGGYRADIEKCRQELRAGESYEICLTTAVELPVVCDSLEYYRVLRRINPAPHSAYLRFGEVDVASSSPERFLRVGADGVVEAKPIKGTAPRGATPDEDAELRDRLATDAKTRAENLMIVDLLRNDLGRVCRVGTVEVPGLMQTESYRTVHQLVSTVRGELAPGLDALDCVRACFPGGSMTGAPKERTMEIIDGLEPGARGVYSGALGFLSCNGSADLSIVIRTAVFADGKVRIGAGGAIVLASDPDEEYQEMLLKLVAPVRAYWEAAAYPPATVVPSALQVQSLLRSARRQKVTAARITGSEAG
ncbi:aminodeoxychorismate synthase component I [Kibdelosporangium aridum]|uniref:aminodeoxychorismate synthase n=1 Tax=Kibdelosporangium aridum TaxID=2030 RepID=A0A428ZDT1_KIBAR|nr:aminodeoxychorismate synthase component I [Kibdelosporangium aridum]RSM86224.1 aminodeoxychorismate synthase component I [Kibdelosporangium aridum]